MSRTDQNEPLNVFLDTEVFDAYTHDYENWRFRHLSRLVDGSLARVVTTPVTIGEIQEHLVSKAEEACSQVVNIIKKTGNAILKNAPSVPFAAITGLDRNAVVGEVKSALEGLLIGWRVETVSLDGVSVASVVDDYFARRPPFSEKKKDEFFDSFTAKALVAWCSSRRAKIYVVSKDKDWEALCGMTDCLQYMQTLDAFLALFPDQGLAEDFGRWASAHSNELEQQIRVELSLLMKAFYSDRGIDAGFSARVENPSLKELVVVNRSARVVLFDGHQAVLQLWCDVSFEADVTFAVGYAQDPVTSDLIGLDKKTVRDNMSRSGWVDILLEAPGNIGKAPGFHVEKICLPCNWLFFYPTR